MKTILDIVVLWVGFQLALAALILPKPLPLTPIVAADEDTLTDDTPAAAAPEPPPPPPVETPPPVPAAFVAPTAAPSPPDVPVPPQPPVSDAAVKSYYYYTQLEMAITEAQRLGRKVVVVFTANTPGNLWCQPCILFDQNVLPDSNVRDYLTSNYVFAVVDVDLYQKTAQLYGASRVPKVFVFTPGSPSMDKFTPRTDAAGFLSQLKSIKGGL